MSSWIDLHSSVSLYEGDEHDLMSLKGSLKCVCCLLFISLDMRFYCKYTQSSMQYHGTD